MEHPANGYPHGAGPALSVRDLLCCVSSPHVRDRRRPRSPEAAELATTSLSYNGQLLLSAHATEAAGSLRSPAAFLMIAPQQNCGR
jgi:hypothetical protein